MVQQASDVRLCSKCGTDLVSGRNWLECHERNCKYICRDCDNSRRRRDYSRTSAEDRRKPGQLPMSENKECSSYLGCYVAENVLESVFTGVKTMPFGNKGYDFICEKGMKIDVKSACITRSPNRSDKWGFCIKRNSIADYFLCLAFDNRNDLNPIHLWLIEGSEINHLQGLSICSSTLDKWSKYELDINKVVLKCNMLKGE